jgi:molybdate transport system substrate-binding protein
MTSTTPPRIRLRPHRRGLAVAFALVALAGLPPTGARAEAPPRELVVFEAASLKQVFTRLARRFETEHAGVMVVANAAGSQELRAQLEHGAAADVFASADRKNMDPLVAAKLVGAPAIFACNEPIVVVRADLAAPPRTLAELPRVDRIVVGAPEVPIGAYTLQILDKAGGKLGADFRKRVEAKIVSRELNVRQVLAKVALGEADAGVVYRSDVLGAADRVHVVEIPRELNVIAAYPIAAVAAARQPELARRFIELVRSPAGVAALREAGFVPCPGP